HFRYRTALQAALREVSGREWDLHFVTPEGVPPADTVPAPAPTVINQAGPYSQASPSPAAASAGAPGAAGPGTAAPSSNGQRTRIPAQPARTAPVARLEPADDYQI